MMINCAIFGNLIGMHQPMDEEYLTKCVVDPVKRTFFLYSSEGDTKEIVCETVEEFMSVLSVVRDTCPEDRLTYSSLL